VGGQSAHALVRPSAVGLLKFGHVLRNSRGDLAAQQEGCAHLKEWNLRSPQAFHASQHTRQGTKALTISLQQTAWSESR
jgi:hypothetical protein